MGNGLNYESDFRSKLGMMFMKLGVLSFILMIADWDTEAKHILVITTSSFLALAVIMFIEYVIAGVKIKLSIMYRIDVDGLYLWLIRIGYMSLYLSVIEKVWLRGEVAIMAKLSRYGPYLGLAIIALIFINKVIKRILNKWDKFVYSGKS